MVRKVAVFRDSALWGIRPWPPVPAGSTESTRRLDRVIILGVILLLIGLLAKIPILWTIGLVLVAVGVVLFLMGSMGRAVAGRRHYW